MVAWFVVDTDEWEQTVDSQGDSASCPPVSRPAAAAQPRPWRNVLLRHDGDSAWWHVRPDGKKAAVLDGELGPGCRFDDLLVWDFVTDEELVAFPDDRTEPERRMCS